MPSAPPDAFLLNGKKRTQRRIIHTTDRFGQNGTTKSGYFQGQSIPVLGTVLTGGQNPPSLVQKGSACAVLNEAGFKPAQQGSSF